MTKKLAINYAHSRLWPQTHSCRRRKPLFAFGHFPNITHAQGVIAHALSRQGKGWFEERLGPNVEIQWFTYNAGPSAMEAMFAGSLDVTYVGQGPALNAHFKSNGEEIRSSAGAANGGAALVVKPDGPIKTPADFRGKKIATPQLGNTQDISCRAWLKAQGFKVTQTGGDVIGPADVQSRSTGVVSKRRSRCGLDGRAMGDAIGARRRRRKVFLEDKDVITTWLVSSVKFLERAPRSREENRGGECGADASGSQTHPEEAQKMLVAELKEETRATSRRSRRASLASESSSRPRCRRT